MHGDTLFGFVAGVVVTVAVCVVISVSVSLPEHGHGYITVPPNNRAALIVEEFRKDAAFESAIQLYASPFRQAYTSGGCQGGQYIVLALDYINSWDDLPLRAIIGHEVGHNLAACHANPTDGSSDRGQQEADGYGMELAGEEAFRLYWLRSGYSEVDIKKKTSEAKAALADLRKRAPLP